MPTAYPLGVISTKHVGSSYICDPPCFENDIDLLVLVVDMKQYCEYCVEKEGWKIDGSYIGNSQFTSIRKESFNQIVTQSIPFFERFSLAADVCKRLNIKNKELRIMVHDAIIHGRYTEPTDTFTKDMFDDIPF